MKNIGNTVGDLKNILVNHAGDFAPVVPEKFLKENPYVFDFTKENSQLADVTIQDIHNFSGYIRSALQKAGRTMGAGGYAEDRVLYFSDLFANGGEPRTVHLGIDVWLPAGTAVYSPLAATVHSFQDNHRLLDYGPTIILEHVLDGVKFFTLYGHLSRSSLTGLAEGMEIKKGQQIATLGNPNENVGWPPHLHFQIISDMLGKKGDFPGVAAVSEQEYYLGLCPDPNLILGFDILPPVKG
jgi:peptidoglycan LD-endopeptidase LytH